MFCAKCGRRAFPVRIACLECNATPPDVPATLEPPEERSRPKRIVCEQCGAPAQDARIACTHCDASLPRPFSLTYEGEEPRGQRVPAYYAFLVPDVTRSAAVPRSISFPLDISNPLRCKSRPGPRYSALNALTGEIAAARSAGMMAAKNAQTASAIAATTRAKGSQLETP